MTLIGLTHFFVTFAPFVVRILDKTNHFGFKPNRFRFKPDRFGNKTNRFFTPFPG